MLLKYQLPNENHRDKSFFPRNLKRVCIGLYYHEGSIMIGVLSEGDTPVSLSLNEFTVVDNRIPSDWVLHQYKEKIFIGPREFTDEFWMYFHEGEDLDYKKWRAAQALFKEVVNKIYAFHGLPPHFVEEKEPEPLKEHEWWKEYLDEDER